MLSARQQLWKCTASLRQASSSARCWHRGFADEKKTGREGTTGEELSGDPNRVPKKGDQEKEGKGAMEGHQDDPSKEGVEKTGKEQGRDDPDVGSANVVDASKDK